MNKRFLLALVGVTLILQGCAVSGSYSGFRVVPSPQAAAPGTQKLCTVPSISGSSRSSGRYSSSVTSTTEVCTWVNANGQQCRSTEDRSYRAQFYPKVEGQKSPRPNNNTNYYWECR